MAATTPSEPAAPKPDAVAPAPIDLEESVAGEEDPGASIDLAVERPAEPDRSREDKPNS